MDDSQNLDRIPRDTVRDEIPGSVDKEFSGTGYALGSPERWLRSQLIDRLENALDLPSRGGGVIGCDVTRFLVEVARCSSQPANARLLPLPGERRQFLVRSKVAAISLRERFADFGNLPLIGLDLLTDGLRSKKGLTAMRGLGYAVEAVFQLALDTDRHGG